MPEVERPVAPIQSKKRLHRSGAEEEHDAYMERLSRVANQVRRDSDPEDSPKRKAAAVELASKSQSNLGLGSMNSRTSRMLPAAVTVKPAISVVSSEPKGNDLFDRFAFFRGP